MNEKAMSKKLKYIHRNIRNHTNKKGETSQPLPQKKATIIFIYSHLSSIAIISTLLSFAASML
jgi:hypothetical protein